MTNPSSLNRLDRQLTHLLAALTLASAATGHAAPVASQWTRSQAGRVIDVLDLAPKGDGWLIELREGHGQPVYSSGFCTQAGTRVVCTVMGSSGKDGHLVLTPRGSSLHYRSWNRQGDTAWQGDFQRSQGVIEPMAEAPNALGAASQWSRSSNGAVIDMLDLTPKADGLLIALREGPAQPVYSSGYCSTAADQAICTVVTRNGTLRHLVLAPRAQGLHYRSWGRDGQPTWDGLFTRSGDRPPTATTAGPGPTTPAAPFEGVRFGVENLVFNQPDAYRNPRNLHHFIVDWAGCRVRNLSQEADAGRVAIKVLVCRDRQRLSFTLQSPGALPVEYDFAFGDSGQAVSGAWRQGSAFGPSVGSVGR